MKKQILMFLLLAMLAAGGTAREVTGKVFCDKEGLEGVVVTDGTRFTTTDKDGIYRLDAVDDADFIYIVTPSGYVASYASGTPRFYRTPSEKSLDFELFRFSAPKGSYALFAVGDTQPGSEHAYQRLEAEAFPELQKHGSEYIEQGMPVAAIMLGDLIWDNPETLGRYKSGLQQLGYPVYPVIGNHDHTEIYSDNYQSEQAYRLHFGPTYYAFNMGLDYYIVLDNIFYKGRRQYDEMIAPEQLEWVKQYTQYIPKGAHVFVAMHAPAKLYSSDKYLQGANELMDLLKDYQARAAVQAQTLEEERNAALKSVIEQEFAAYIVDKAAQMGAVCTAQVTCQLGEDGVFLPRSATVQGSFTPQQQEELARILEEELAIPRARQSFPTKEEGFQ